MQKSLAALTSLLVIAAAPNAAHAGAWLQKDGENQLIISSNYLSANEFFDSNGNKDPSKQFSKAEIGYYDEYGLNNKWTIGNSANISSTAPSSYIDPNDFSKYQIGGTTFFARTYLAQGDNYVISVEPRMELVFEQKDEVNPSGTSIIPEIKFSYGQSAGIFNHCDSFSDLSLTYGKLFSNGVADRLKFEATAGTRPFADVPILFLAQSFYDRSLAGIGINTNSGNYELLKLQISAAYESSQFGTFQLGYFNNVYGQNTAAGQGVIVSAWFNF